MSREYPSYPVPSAAALVYQQGLVLLIKRRFAPGAGKWSLPGGKIELGEKAADTAAREVQEECGVNVAIQRLLDVADAIFYDREGGVHYHYVIVVYLAGYVSGQPHKTAETLDVRWVPLEEVANYELTGTTAKALAAFKATIL